MYLKGNPISLRRLKQPELQVHFSEPIIHKPKLKDMRSKKKYKHTSTFSETIQPFSETTQLRTYYPWVALSSHYCPVHSNIEWSPNLSNAASEKVLWLKLIVKLFTFWFTEPIQLQQETKKIPSDKSPRGADMTVTMEGAKVTRIASKSIGTSLKACH